MVSERFMRHHYGASGFVDKSKPSEQLPHYRKVEEGKGGKTQTFMIVKDEGWRESVICCSMYEADADWLINEILRSHGRGAAPVAKEDRK